jgi:hypothetical protein
MRLNPKGLAEGAMWLRWSHGRKFLSSLALWPLRTATGLCIDCHGGQQSPERCRPCWNDSRPKRDPRGSAATCHGDQV